MLGWARSQHQIDGITGFASLDALPAFLQQTDVLVCLLPLTDATTGILNADLFNQLPAGSYLINAARGGHLVDEDLLTALETGQLAGACLDVFHQEPLPANHAFWAHPAITITPHVASLTNPASAVHQILENCRRARAGEALLHPVDRATGY